MPLGYLFCFATSFVPFQALAAAVQPRLEFVLLLQSADIELSKAVYTVS